MSLLFLFSVKEVVEAGALEESFLYCWALFAIADALWFKILCGRK